MITVKLEKREPKSTIKKFPKLMHWGDTIVEIYEHPDKTPEYIGIYRTGDFAGTMVIGIEIRNGQDYNEPITIQNA
jgi:hypothetical protein